MISRAEYNRQKQLRLDEICQAIVELNIEKDGLMTKLEHLDQDYEIAEDNKNEFSMDAIQAAIDTTIDDIEDVDNELKDRQEELDYVENESYQDALADKAFDDHKE